jgi:hypothetical protein
MNSQHTHIKWLHIILILSLMVVPTAFASATQVQFDQTMNMAINLWYANQGDASITTLQITQANGTGAIEGKITEGGRSIEGANVYAWSIMLNSIVTQSSRSAADGSYKLEGLDAGEYFVVAMADEFLPAFYGNGQNPLDAEMVTVADDEMTSGIDIKLKKTKPADGAISGIVTEDGDGPIAGAWVTVLSRQNPFNMQSTFAVSNDAGEYKITNLQNGAYYLVTYAYGYVPEMYDDTLNPMLATAVMVNSAETPDINISLARGGSIAGMVTDGDGAPMEGVKVTAMASIAMGSGMPGLSGMTQMALTDESGNYKILGLPDGDFIVAASLMKCQSCEVKFWDNKYSHLDADLVTIESGAEITDINFSFVLPTAKISGIVTDPDGNPLKDVYISWFREEGGVYFNYGRLWRNQLTDENGYYELTNLAKGTYFVSAWHWDWMNFNGIWYENADSLKDATPIPLTDGQIRDDINMMLDLTSDYGTISGAVTLDESGEPVANAFVSIVPNKNHPRNHWKKRLPTTYTLSDAEGNYTLSPVYKGDYRVVVRVNNHREYFDDKTSWDEADIVTVEAGMDTPDINFGVPGMPTDGSVVNGVITDEENGAALEGALVAIFPTRTHKWFNGDMHKWSSVYYTTFTDASGTFAIGGIPEGDYIASAWARDYVGEFYDDVRNPFKANVLTLDGVNVMENVDFALKPRTGRSFAEGPGQGRYGSIGGICQSTGGDPVSGAFIYAIDNDENVIASEITGEDGSYSLDGLEEGDYTVMASRSLYETTFYPNAPDLSTASSINLDAEGEMDISDATVTMATGQITSTNGDTPTTAPTAFGLSQNFPNPFNPTTVIEYQLPEQADVILQVFNVQGQLINTLVNNNQTAQSYKVVWDGRDMNGAMVPSGVYFYQIQANSFTETRALLFIK